MAHWLDPEKRVSPETGFSFKPGFFMHRKLQRDKQNPERDDSRLQKPTA
jgi:hypothetical protein